MKLCKDCVFYVPVVQKEGFVMFDVCMHPEAGVADVITGHIRTGCCAEMRGVYRGGEGKCGNDGKLWEAKV